MSRIDDLIAEHCPNGVEVKPLGQVGQFIRGNGLQKKDFADEGVGCIHYGQIYTHYGTSATETKSFVSPELAMKLRSAQPGDLVLATTSENDADVAKAVAWLGHDSVAVSGESYVFKHSLDPLYASYFFQTDSFQQQKRRFITGTKVKRVSGTDLARIEIPVPPRAVQREIVAILTKMEALEAELEAELEARRRQYSHYQVALLSPNSRASQLTLGDIGRVVMCRRVFKHETAASGEVPFFKIGTFGSQPDAYISKSLFDAYRHRYPFPRAGEVLLSAAGTIGRAIEYDGEPAYFQDSNIVWIDNDEDLVLNRYLFHWYKTVSWSTDGGTIRRLYNENIRRTPIAVPPLPEQRRVIDILDRFDALVNDISIGLPAELNARRRQYAYYRNRLFDFSRLAA